MYAYISGTWLQTSASNACAAAAESIRHICPCCQHWSLNCRKLVKSFLTRPLARRTNVSASRWQLCGSEGWLCVTPGQHQGRQQSSIGGWRRGGFYDMAEMSCSKSSYRYTCYVFECQFHWMPSAYKSGFQLNKMHGHNRYCLFYNTWDFVFKDTAYVVGYYLLRIGVGGGALIGVWIVRLFTRDTLMTCRTSRWRILDTPRFQSAKCFLCILHLTTGSDFSLRSFSQASIHTDKWMGILRPINSDVSSVVEKAI